MSPKRKTKKALLREEERGSAETETVRSFTTRGRPRKGPRGTMTTGGSRCVWCGAGIPDTETARTFETPPEREHVVPMPAGERVGDLWGGLPRVAERGHGVLQDRGMGDSDRGKENEEKEEDAMSLKWGPITELAAQIVNSYSTSVTLRQLFYRLVSRGVIPNNQNAYKALSKHTAEARREGWFPDLIDRTRRIERYQTFISPDSALHWLSAIYRRDRTENQDQQIFIAVEKAGMVVQLQDWFGDFGFPIMALGGYSSQTFVKTVGEAIWEEDHDNDRPSVLLYAGDFDPSGEDIDRDFIERLEQMVGYDLLTVHRIGLLPEHIEQYQLPEYPGKETDSRKWQFMAKHGKLVQVELDALDPNDLRALYQVAIDQYFDQDAFGAALRQEDQEEELIRRVGLRIDEVRALIEEEE